MVLILPALRNFEIIARHKSSVVVWASFCRSGRWRAAHLRRAERKKTKTAYTERIWSLDGTPAREGSLQNRFFDSLIGRLIFYG